MGNLISISNDTSLKKLVALGNKLEEVLQEQFGIYGPTVYWQLLDEELMSMREKKNKRRESVCFRHLGVYHSGRHPLFFYCMKCSQRHRI